jgi:hypothetical protein
LNDRCSIELELSALRSEIAAFANLPVLSPQFATWLGKLFSLVEAGFGADSDEMRDLRAISPELPSEFYDSVTDRLGSLGLDEKWTSQLLAKLYNDVPEGVFRRRLYDYDDLIAALILGLRSSR